MNLYRFVGIVHASFVGAYLFEMPHAMVWCRGTVHVSQIGCIWRNDETQLCIGKGRNSACRPVLCHRFRPLDRARYWFDQRHGCRRFTGCRSRQSSNANQHWNRASSHDASSAQGLFEFTDLPPGEYKVSITKTGFKAWDQSSITLAVAQHITLYPALQVGAATEQIEITAEAAFLTTDNSSLSGVVESQQIEQLPLNGRNALQLEALEPGIVSTGTSGQFGAVQVSFTSSGGRDIDTNYTLDGGINVDPFYAISNNYPNPDALQEFSVSSRNYSARFGRGSTDVSAVTRSGTNTFHGSLFEFMRTTDLDAHSILLDHDSRFPSQPVRRFNRRTRHQEQVVLLWQLSRHPASGKPRRRQLHHHSHGRERAERGGRRLPHSRHRSADQQAVPRITPFRTTASPSRPRLLYQLPSHPTRETTPTTIPASPPDKSTRQS